jgi:hypothetical protein
MDHIRETTGKAHRGERNRTKMTTGEQAYNKLRQILRNQMDTWSQTSGLGQMLAGPGRVNF